MSVTTMYFTVISGLSGPADRKVYYFIASVTSATWHQAFGKDWVALIRYMTCTAAEYHKCYRLWLLVRQEVFDLRFYCTDRKQTLTQTQPKTYPYPYHKVEVPDQ